MTQEASRIVPSLQAFLVCERVETAADGAHTLHRVIDRLNVAIDIETEQPLDRPPQVTVPIEFTVFTRWGAGVGHFKQHVAISNPSGETMEFGEKEFWLPSKATTHSLIGRVSLSVTEPGQYTLAAVLDNQKVGEYVLVVDFKTHIRERRPPG